MSQVRPKLDGWIGYGDGASALVETGVLMDADHPLVLERPELFEPIEEPKPEAPRRGRPPAKKATSSGDADG